jgi:hypothetical protein
MNMMLFLLLTLIDGTYEIKVKAIKCDDLKSTNHSWGPSSHFELKSSLQHQVEFLLRTLHGL